jgi:hypothetical protein
MLPTCPLNSDPSNRMDPGARVWLETVELHPHSLLRVLNAYFVPWKSSSE